MSFSALKTLRSDVTLNFMFIFTILIFTKLANRSVLAQHNHGDTFERSQMHQWETPMEMDVRTMHRFCTGECFYLPDECKENLDELKCKNIISIQKYEPPCNNPEATDSVDMCERKGHLFIISILRRLPPEIVHQKRYNYKDEGDETIRCKVEPFVAIAFSDNTEALVTETDPEKNKLGDVFYTCVADDPYVTTWINPIKRLPKTAPSCLDNFDSTKPPEGDLENMQVLDTKPYPPMGAAVLWSKIVTRYDQFAMGCKFVISNLRKDLSIKLNENGTIQVPVFGNKSIKLANGLAYSKNGVLEDVIFKSTAGKALAVVEDMPDDASILTFPGLTSWNLESMALRKPIPSSFIRGLKNQIASQEMRKIYDLCNHKRALCFTRGDEPFCLVKKSCHYLLALQALNRKFSTLRFHLITQPIKNKGVHNRVHPKSWSGVGFSNDTRMGQDMIFVCEFYGQQEPVIKTGYNAKSMPIFGAPGDPSMAEYTVVANYIDARHDTTLCIFDVNTQNITHPAFYYAKPGTTNLDPESWPKLHFSLTHHEYHLLMAQGTTVYYDEKISKHTHRGVSPHKFSQEIYWSSISGQSSHFAVHFLPCYVSFTLTITSRIYF